MGVASISSEKPLGGARPSRIADALGSIRRVIRSLVEWETPSYTLMVVDISVCFEGGDVLMRVVVTQTENGPGL